MSRRDLGVAVRRVKRSLGVALAVTALGALVVGPGSALAVEHHPTGDFAAFTQCPLANSQTELCLFAQTESGEFVAGKKTVPITKTITLQGGMHENPTTEQLEFIGAENGVTLSHTPQTVPGGLLGLVAPEFLPGFLKTLFNEFINKGPTGATATTELAAPASQIQVDINNLINEEGNALVLPVKVHLENSFLGSNCYIGSNAHPIELELTTGVTSPPGPNKPIHGNSGEFEIKDEAEYARISGNELVNNSFPAPGAEGCGGIFSFLIDPAVDAELGIPAAAGHNTAILKGTLQEGLAEAVRASE
jgi:hypothetical protein